MKPEFALVPGAVLRPELVAEIEAARAKHFAWGHTVTDDVRFQKRGQLMRKAQGEMITAELALDNGRRAYARSLTINAVALLIAELDRLDAEGQRESEEHD